MQDEQTKFGLDKDKFQIFLFVCPGNIPFNFVAHPWFVVNEKGEISRWEVLFRKIDRESSWGHLYKNFFPPFQGIEVFPFVEKYFWRGKLLGKIEGEVAERMAKFIKDSPVSYPYTQKYFLSGPNSNTYAQWILDTFPKFSVSLPWNAVGKNYKIKEFAAKKQNQL
jgi:hypothetical protein